jgi:hypothetical protein
MVMMRPSPTLLLLLTVTSACGGSSSRFSDEDAEAYYVSSDRAEEQPDMGAVKSAYDEVREKLESLDLEVSRFGDENWREVVPDVEIALEAAESALEELEELLRRESVED